MPLTYFDTHCHLSMLEQDPLETLIHRSKEMGVEYFTTVSTDPSNWQLNQNISNQFENIYFSLGLHPHEAKDWTRVENELLGFFENNHPPKKCVAIGEMGLDYHYNHSPREQQIEAFEAQLRLCNKFNLPAIIHCRDAFNDLYQSIKTIGLSSKGGVLHCFTGNWEEAKQGLDFGLKVSFSGIVTFKKADSLREAAKKVPHSEILIETDCPYLAPVPNRGKPNEPSFLPFTANQLASLLAIPEAEFALLTTQNAKNFFGV